MRLYNYKLLNEMCDSFKEAIKYTAENGNSSVLKTCVELLSAIQTNLEANKKSLRSDKAFDIILSLTKEFIDIMSNTNNEYENVIELSEELSNVLSNDIDYKLKILFVAELGGKWDAMASVYEEFIKRDDCEVDVVIQPIFREVQYNTGEIKKDTILEDYLTPMGIKNIPYDKYNIEKVRPDITFFSQPYESVTVPMFWPRNMSKYTRVVYLPYYFTRDISKTHFDSFFLSDTQEFSWRIACQSEAMKKYYSLYASRKGENVIAAGIPKLDYPLKLNKENTPCPKEWKEKISNRKTFLWNTHFSKTLNGDSPFSNIIEVINIFINKPGISLIWRPHPMAETIVKLYNPHLYPAYKEILNKVNESDNIVIDESSTYDNAFVWSDAMISDWSSLEVQYMLMDKPYATLDDMPRPLMDYWPTKLWDFRKKNVLLYGSGEIEEFVKSVCNGNDPAKENRKYLREKCMDLADGYSGKRIAEKIISDFKSENELLTVESNNKSSGCVLIIGPENDSMPCIKRLEELNICYRVCNDYIDNEDYSADVPLCSLEELYSDDKYDNVIITDRRHTDEVIRQITEVYKVPKNRIMNFWKMYNASLPVMYCDRVMKNPNTDKYEGLILGASQTEAGVITKDLKKNFADFSIADQDLYYQLKTLEYCLEKYPEKFEGLKYAVIGLDDYRFFSFDTSKSESAVKYLSSGGYNLDPHNFKENRYFNCTYEEAVNAAIASRYQGLSDNDIDMWNKYFKDEIYKYVDNFDIDNSVKGRIKTVNDAEIAEYSDYLAELRPVVSEKTIEDNIHCLELIFEKLLNINKEIKIYITVIPGYIKTEITIYNCRELRKYFLEFDKIIEDLHEKYQFKMLDFNRDFELSHEKAFYFDAVHLNYFGAKWITNKLNEILFGD